ncbi:hypothetical protein WKI71_19450 [Streptomyces sp. MS1.AVA.1]|uniref:Uncharacterized protein n=1 Tax=Streptomyces machairae TaxID=3134109 RepID=A0ABU8ULL8_9ACTN
MTEIQPSAPARAKSGHSAGGVEHVNEPHHDQFVVVGNHLAQHPELSLTAIGLAVHIQSLPARAPVGIKTLAAKFPRGRSVSPPPCGSWRHTDTWRAPRSVFNRAES